MRTAARGTTARLVPLAAAALVLCGISARLAPHSSPRLTPARATSARSASLVAEAKIPTPLETVAIRAGRTFLDPPTTDTDLYLAVVDACIDPAAQTFDQHLAHVGSVRRMRRRRRGRESAEVQGAGGLSVLRRRSLPAAAEDEEQQAAVRSDGDTRPAAQSGGLRRAGQAPLSPHEEDDAPAALLLRPPADDDGDGDSDGTAAEDSLTTGSSSTTGLVPELSGPRRFDPDPGPPHLPVVAQADKAGFVKTAARSPEKPPGAAARSSGAGSGVADVVNSVENPARSHPETPPGAAARSSGAKASAAAVPRRKYPVRHALVEAHYKPSTQVLRLRIQTLGFRRITGVNLSGPSTTLPNGRRIARRGEGSGAGAQWLATGGRTPAAVPVPGREDDGDDDGAARRAAETDHRGTFEGDGGAFGPSGGNGGLGAPPPLRPLPAAAPAAGRRIVDRPTVRDAFWHEAKLTDDEAASLFLGELHVDIYAAARPHFPARGFLACAQPGGRCTPPPALAGGGPGSAVPAVFRPDSCDPSNELPGWLVKYTRNRLR